MAEQPVFKLAETVVLTVLLKTGAIYAWIIQNAAEVPQAQEDWTGGRPLSGKDHYLGQHGSEISKQRYDSQWLDNGRILLEAKSKKAVTVADLLAAY